MEELKGIERIKELAIQVKNPGIKKVAEYLINRDDMDDKYKNEDKDLDKMWVYITEQAKGIAENNIACVEDKDVYNWAIHYWDEKNEDLEKEKNVSYKQPKTEKETKVTDNLAGTETLEQSKQNENDIVFKWKGKEVTRAQFNSKEYLSW